MRTFTSKTLFLCLGLLGPIAISAALTSALPRVDTENESHSEISNEAQTNVDPVSVDDAIAINVTTDIPLLASMIANIVGEGDSVTSLVTASDSPHTFAFRPSTMRAVQNADLLVLIGEQFMPGVTNAIVKLSSDSELLSLLDLDGIQLYESGDDHDHSLRIEQAELMDSVDPHIWTDPINLKTIAAAVRDKLIEIDPSRQEMFTSNADQVIAELDAFHTLQKRRWEATDTVAFVSMHDTTHYFSQRYGLHAEDSLFSGEHAAPSARQLRAFETTIQQSGVECILTDPNTNVKWTRTLNDLNNVSVASIDALGVNSPDENYLNVLNTLSDTLVSCLTRS